MNLSISLSLNVLQEATVEMGLEPYVWLERQSVPGLLKSGRTKTLGELHLQ